MTDSALVQVGVAVVAGLIVLLVEYGFARKGRTQATRDQQIANQIAIGNFNTQSIDQSQKTQIHHHYAAPKAEDDSDLSEAFVVLLLIFVAAVVASAVLGSIYQWVTFAAVGVLGGVAVGALWLLVRSPSVWLKAAAASVIIMAALGVFGSLAIPDNELNGISLRSWSEDQSDLTFGDRVDLVLTSIGLETAIWLLLQVLLLAAIAIVAASVLWELARRAGAASVDEEQRGWAASLGWSFFMILMGLAMSGVLTSGLLLSLPENIESRAPLFDEPEQGG